MIAVLERDRNMSAVVIHQESPILPQARILAQ